MFRFICSFSSGLGRPAEDLANGLHQEPEPRGIGSEGRRRCKEAGQVCVRVAISLLRSPNQPYLISFETACNFLAFFEC